MPNLFPREVTLHSAATATADGGFVPCDGIGAVGLQVANTGGTFTITCEGTIDGVWVALPVQTKTDNTVTAGGTITAVGLYVVDVSCCHQFRARLSAATGCSVTVKALLYEGTVGYVDTSTVLADLEAHAGTIDTNIASALTSLQALDNIVSGFRGLVTEDNSATIAGNTTNATACTVYNVTLASANTEYSQALPANTRELRFRCRTLYDVRYAFVTGKVATPTAPYLTLPAGSDYFSDNNNLAALTVYWASAQAGVVVEVEAWT